MSEFLSKICVPKVTGTLERERLFRLLDKGLEKGFIWIAAPAGSGKTTLVAGWIEQRKVPFIWYQVDTGDSDPATFFSGLALAARKATPKKRKPLPVLTPEYLEGIPMFSRRFFEALAVKLPPSSVIVLDNYQEVPVDSPLHEILRRGVQAVQPRLKFIVISRSDCHPLFSSICLSHSAQMIGWPDIRFSLEESKTMALTHGCRPMDDQTMLQLHEKANGWAAGLVLLLRTSVSQRVVGPSAETPIMLFEYFAQEIFLRTDGAVRDFLLMTSFLPSLTVSMAEKLTANSNSHAILNRLCREYYFIESYAGDKTFYQYHPLFREFLRNTAAGLYATEEISRLKLLAADLLVEQGQFDDAANILLEVKDHERLIALIRSQAETMISKGRLMPLSQWLSAILPEHLSRDPWLCYWRAVCLHPFDLAASEKFFVQAFHLFRKKQAPWEALLAWAGIAACIITEWRDFSRLDPWIEWLVREGDAALQAVSIELSARIVGLILICLTFRQPQNPKIDFYENKAAALLDEPLDQASLLTISSHLMTHYTKMGLLVKARAVIDLVDPKARHIEGLVAPERILWYTVKSSYYALSGEKTQCLQENRKGLNLAASAGIHIYDIFMFFFGAMAGFIDGDRKIIDHYMEKITKAQGGSSRILPIIYRQILGWRYILEEDYRSAKEHVRAAMEQTLSLGSAIEHANNRICYSRTLFELGRREKGRDFLREGSAFYPSNSVYTTYMLLTMKAYFAYQEDDPATGDNLLREAMDLGARHSIMMHHYWSAEITRYLCVRAMRLGIETSYARELVERHSISLAPAAHLRADPRLPVVIHTLGRFYIQINGQPLLFPRKAPRKPLELLKAIIAFGGANVAAEKICDALWPDADGDRAHNSFKFTLHQLRRLLRSDTAIELCNGKVSLNTDYCWTDAHVLLYWTEEILDRCRNSGLKSRKNEGPFGNDVFRKINELYRGDFLPEDVDLFWTAPLREAIQKRMQQFAEATKFRLEVRNP